MSLQVWVVKGGCCYSRSTRKFQELQNNVDEEEEEYLDPSMRDHFAKQCGAKVQQIVSFASYNNCCIIVLNSL